jgi:hypothetical protein
VGGTLLSLFYLSYPGPSAASEIPVPPANPTTQAPIQPPRERGLTSDAIVGFIGSLLGAGIGAAASLGVWWLATADQRRRDATEQARRAHSARELVRSEIDHNLRVLAEYRHEIRSDNPVRLVGNQNGREWIASHPPPRWSTVAWHQMLGRLPEAVTESELVATYTFYANLDSLAAATEKAIAYHLQRVPEDLVSTAFLVQDQAIDQLGNTSNPLSAHPTQDPGSVEP